MPQILKEKHINPIRNLLNYKMKINKKTLSWLTNCPATDINFIGHLREANIPTIEEALKSPGLSKLAIQKLNSALKKKKK